MIFLIDYDRRAGRIVTLRRYEDSAAHVAAEDRLALELDLNRRGIDREVVLFDAANEDLLRKTHSRYFEGIQELANRLILNLETH